MFSINDELKQEFEALLAEGLPARQASRSLGVSPSTGIAWAKAWRERQGQPSSEDGPIGADEERVSTLLLEKSERLLAGIVNEPGSKAKYEVAKAVEALLGKYLAMTGKVQESHVTLDGGGADLDALLKQLVPTPQTETRTA